VPVGGGVLAELEGSCYAGLRWGVVGVVCAVAVGIHCEVDGDLGGAAGKDSVETEGVGLSF